MIVNNREMFHIHKNGEFDDLWKVGNELLIDESFDSKMCNFNNVCAGVKNKKGEIVLLDKYIKEFRESINSDEKILNIKNLEEHDFIEKAKYLYYMLLDS